MSHDEMKVTAANRAFVGFIARRPKTAIALGLVLVGALLPGMARVKADFTHTGFFWDDDPKILRFEAFERRFGNDDAVSLAIHSPSGVFDMETATLIKRLTERMWQVPEVIRVDSLANFNWVHAKGDDIVIEPLFPEELTPEILAERQKVALSHEVLPGYLVSKDAKTTMIYSRMKPGLDHASDAKTITLAARKVVAEFQTGDHRIYLSGGPPLTYSFEETSSADVKRLAPMAIIIAALFLVPLLRSVWGSVLSIVTVLLSVLGTYGIAGYTGLVQTAISTGVPTILIAVGIADTVHVLVTFFRGLRTGLDRRTAAHRALTENLLATFLTALTTAVGFFSFVSANLKPLGVLGIMSGFGTMLSWLLAQLFVGGLLFVLPIKAKPVPPERFETTERRAFALVDLIVRRRWFVIGLTTVLSAAALVYSLGLSVNSDPVKYFGPTVPTRVANEFIEKSMGSARAFELVLDAGQEDGVKDPAFLRKVEALAKWLEAQPGVTRPISILDVLKQTHRALNGDRPEEFRIADNRETIAQELFLYTMGLPQGMDINDRVSVRNDAIRMSVLNSVTRSTEIVALVHRTEKKAHELGLNAHGTGKYFLYQDTNDYVVDSFLTSLWSANIVIGLIMMLFLRSVKLGIISMIPNVVPLFAGGALLRFIGQPLDMATVLVASITLGISIDDTSHVLANFAYLRRQGVAAHTALKKVMAMTAPALLSTNGIVITAFASFVTASFVPYVFFGILMAFILTLALIADMFLTPALLLVGVRKQPAHAPSIPVPIES